jgi:hypothetical protein
VTLVGWARFDDGYTDNPKIRDAGAYAELLDMRAIIYCARYDTDGRLTPTGLVVIRHGIPRLGEKIDRLVQVGRWSVDPGGGWQIRGFLEHNPSRAEREVFKEKNRERQARWRAANNGVTDASHRGGGVITRERCARCGKLQLDCLCETEA